MRLFVKVVANDDGSYTAICPSLPGCTSRGQTREMATEKLNEAIRGYLAVVSNFVPENLNVHQVVES